ncbi:hypothetical protein ABN028_19690 [Actinopolymorpha sp. B17G11]|uniref:hypothetical protein n=1 Tax=Actinopolymorpha sp. B17G11 TaxID=3160861 RepID=UPI0032E38FD2
MLHTIYGRVTRATIETRSVRLTVEVPDGADAADVAAAQLDAALGRNWDGIGGASLALPSVEHGNHSLVSLLPVDQPCDTCAGRRWVRAHPGSDDQAVPSGPVENRFWVRPCDCAEGVLDPFAAGHLAGEDTGYPVLPAPAWPGDQLRPYLADVPAGWLHDGGGILATLELPATTTPDPAPADEPVLLAARHPERGKVHAFAYSGDRSLCGVDRADTWETVGEFDPAGDLGDPCHNCSRFASEPVDA